MVGSDWQGGKKDGRLYDDVRTKIQRVIREKYERLEPYLDERARRLWAGSEAITYGRGGVRAVAEALELSPEVVIEGRRELSGKLTGTRTPAPAGRRRSESESQAGGGSGEGH